MAKEKISGGGYSKGHFDRPKHDIIPLEGIDRNEFYAFTFNPCDSYQHFRSVERLRECYHDLKEKIFFNHIVYYELYPELSSKGRFHVHGYIQIQNPVNFYLNVIPHLCAKGTMVIKLLNDSDVWGEYCHKQYYFHNHIRSRYSFDVPITLGSPENGRGEMIEQTEGPLSGAVKLKFPAGGLRPLSSDNPQPQKASPNILTTMSEIRLGIK